MSHKISDFEQVKEAIATRYVFPGGYEIGLITDDGGVLCTVCAKDNIGLIKDSMARSIKDGWRIVAGFLDCDVSRCTCDQCGHVFGYDIDENEGVENGN